MAHNQGEEKQQRWSVLFSYLEKNNDIGIYLKKNLILKIVSFYLLIKILVSCNSIVSFIGTLFVGGQEYRGEAPGRFRGLDLREQMYVGGVPDFSMIARAGGYRQGFVGGMIF